LDLESDESSHCLVHSRAHRSISLVLCNRFGDAIHDPKEKGPSADTWVDNGYSRRCESSVLSKATSQQIVHKADDGVHGLDRRVIASSRAAEPRIVALQESLIEVEPRRGITATQLRPVIPEGALVVK
jgi:hypothetical protein